MNNYEKKYVERLRSEYTERPHNAVDDLRALDSKVTRPARVVAVILGVLGCLVLGTGMSMAMKVIFDMMYVGIAVGCVGLLLLALVYPVYRAILKSRKAKYGEAILSISNSLLNGEQN